MSKIDWIEMAHAIAKAGFFSSFVLNFAVIFLTANVIKRNFGPYKYLIIYSALFGIIFASSEYISYPLMHMKDDGYIYFTKSHIFGASKTTMKLLLLFYAGSYGATLAILSVQFIYRYWAIFSNDKLIYFKRWRLICWLLYTIYFGFQWAGGIHFFAQPDDYLKDFIRKEIKEWYNLKIDDIPCFGVFTYEKSENETRVRWFNLGNPANMTLVMITQYSIMIFCGYGMYKNMNEKLKMLSISLQVLHKQFFTTLMLQITVPTFTLFVPMCFTIYAALFDFKMSIPNGALICTITLYPAIDSFIVLYNVSDYRKAIFKTSEKISTFLRLKSKSSGKQASRTQMTTLRKTHHMSSSNNSNPTNAKVF